MSGEIAEDAYAHWLAGDLARLAPPDIPLRLTATGPGSRPDIVEYVRTVIEQRATVNDDTTADRLARALVASILSRLGAGYSVATGSASIMLVPARHHDEAFEAWARRCGKIDP